MVIIVISALALLTLINLWLLYKFINHFRDLEAKMPKLSDRITRNICLVNEVENTLNGQIDHIKDTVVYKTDPVYSELSLVALDAKNQGEGFFLVKKTNKSEYFFRVDPHHVYPRGKS